MTEFLIECPDDARWIYLFAHGAGAGMRHEFMEKAAAALAREKVATVRWEFPYMAARRSRPDRADVAEDAVRHAWDRLRDHSLPALPMFAGGKSFGGRMTSRAAAWTLGGLPDLAGIAFMGFPLYGAGKPPSTERADHLARVNVPLLFVQGSRDELADLATLRPVVEKLGPRATLHVIEGADHGFSNRNAYAEIATTIAAWMARVTR